MGANEAIIQLHTGSGAIRHGNRPVVEAFWWRQQITAPRHLAPLELENAKVAQDGRDMNTCGRRDWPARVVRGHLDAIRIGRRSDASQLEQPAAVFDVGHDDADGPIAAELGESL